MVGEHMKQVALIHKLLGVYIGTIILENYLALSTKD
jgi:hypothetical protein